MNTNNANTNAAAANTDDGFSLGEWAAANPKAFDRYDVYRQQVEPLVAALRDACKEHGLPFSFVIGHTQQENGDVAVACGSHFPSLTEAPAEIIAAHSMGKGEIREAMAIHQAGMVRAMRLQAFFPASGSVH